MAQYSKKDKESIGGRVEALRQKRGWSAEKLAEMLNTTRSSINMKERGERPFSLDEACNICGLFDLTLDELVSGVKTENIQIHKALGLDDKAIGNLSILWSTYGSEVLSAVNKVLASFETVIALADFINFEPKVEGYLLTKGQEEDVPGVVTCSMSEEVYGVVLEQNLLRTLRMIKEKKESSKYYSSLVDYVEASKKEDT